VSQAKRLSRGLRDLLFAEGGLPLVWLALTVVALIPVWHQRLLPQLDTPNHLALVRGWHDYHDPALRIADYYALRIRPVPYLLYYLTIHLLMFVCDIEVANKLFLSAYLILFPLSVLALARALGRSPWLALGGFLLAFNQNWIYGFASFLMGLALMMFALAALLRLLDHGRRRDAFWLVGLCLGCYFSHVEDWFCFGVCALVLLVLHHRAWRRCLMAAAAMAPSVLLALAAYAEERRERSYFKRGDGLSNLAGSWRDFPTAVHELPRRVMELFPGRLDSAVLLVLTATVVALAVWQGTARADEDELRRRRKWWLLGALFVVYLSLPYQISKPMSWWYVSPRVPAMMAPLALLLPALTSVHGRRRLLFAPLIVCAVVLPLELAKLYKSFSQRNAAFLYLVDDLPQGSRCLVVVRGMMRGPGSEELSGDPASSGPVYWHFSSWPMALKGGYGPYLFDQGIPLVPRVRLKAPPWTHPDTFNIRQAPEFDYYLVRHPADEMDREPALRVEQRLGEWVLYRRIHTLTEEP
jgi:hypothetical protein